MSETSEVPSLPRRRKRRRGRRRELPSWSCRGEHWRMKAAACGFCRAAAEETARWRTRRESEQSIWPEGFMEGEKEREKRRRGRGEERWGGVMSGFLAHLDTAEFMTRVVRNLRVSRVETKVTKRNLSVFYEERVTVKWLWRVLEGIQFWASSLSFILTLFQHLASHKTGVIGTYSTAHMSLNKRDVFMTPVWALGPNDWCRSAVLIVFFSIGSQSHAPSDGPHGTPFIEKLMAVNGERHVVFLHQAWAAHELHRICLSLLNIIFQVKKVTVRRSLCKISSSFVNYTVSLNTRHQRQHGRRHRKGPKNTLAILTTAVLWKGSSIVLRASWYEGPALHPP